MSISFPSQSIDKQCFEVQFPSIKACGVEALIKDPGFSLIKDSYYDIAQYDWVEKDYSTDFGKLAFQKPRGVFKPRSQESLLKFVELANKHKINITCRAQGHSIGGQVLCANSIVIDLKDSPKEFNFPDSDKKDTLVVSGHATWKEVLDFTLPHGLTVPVLTDYLKLSLGGTLNIGGLGGSSYRKGSQADNILALHILTLNGQILFCSKTENADLFHAALCSLGQICIILDVTLSVVESKEYTDCRLLYYRTPEQFFKDQHVLYAQHQVDHLKGFIQNQNNDLYYVIEAAVFHNKSEDDFSKPYEGLVPEKVETKKLSYVDFVGEVTQYVEILAQNKKLEVPHPWYGVLLPEDQVAEHLKLALDSPFLVNGDIIIIYPIDTTHLNQPFLIRPNGKTIYLLNILYNCSFMADANLNFSKIIEHNKTLYWDAARRGGCCYPPRAMPSMHDWELHFGKTWYSFCEMKAKYDPNKIRNLNIEEHTL